MKIVMSFFSGDVWLIKKNLEWIKELEPRIDRDLVLACDDKTNPSEVKALAESIFRKVELCQYPRAYHNGQLMEKWPWQQNNSFANTCRYMGNQKEPWFWMETDSCALTAGWWKVLEDEYTKGGKPFGGHWNEKTGIFNGVAVYPPKVGLYSSEAMMAALKVDSKGNQAPWDAACSRQVYPNLHIMNNVMQHIWELPDAGVPTFPDLATVAKWVRPNVVLFHRCKDGTLIDRMRDLKSKHVEIELHGKDLVHTKHLKYEPLPEPVIKTMSKVDIFMVTFRRDLEFTAFALKSIQKFVTGYNKVIVVVPTRDARAFRHVTQFYPFAVLKTFIEQPGKGMLHHEAIICRADEFSDADFILHTDSDCIFKESVNIQTEYFKDGKPIMLKERFERIGECVKPWQDAVEAALGFKPEFETMRRHPSVHPRWLYAKVREAIQKHTGKNFLEYVLSCKNEFPQGFAEFPTLGAWALQYAPDAHHWIDVTIEPRPADRLVQCWTHGGMNMENNPYPGTTPRKFCTQLLQ